MRQSHGSGRPEERDPPNRPPRQGWFSARELSIRTCSASRPHETRERYRSAMSQHATTTAVARCDSGTGHGTTRGPGRPTASGHPKCHGRIPHRTKTHTHRGKVVRLAASLDRYALGRRRVELVPRTRLRPEAPLQPAYMSRKDRAARHPQGDPSSGLSGNIGQEPGCGGSQGVGVVGASRGVAQQRVHHSHQSQSSGESSRGDPAACGPAPRRRRARSRSPAERPQPHRQGQS